MSRRCQHCHATGEDLVTVALGDRRLCAGCWVDLAHSLPPGTTVRAVAMETAELASLVVMHRKRLADITERKGSR